MFHLADLDDLEYALERAVKIAVEAVEGADRGGIMVNDRERHLIGNTDDIAAKLQQLEKEVNEGPCYDALHAGESIWTEDIKSDVRFPAFSKAIADLPVGSSLALPLKVRDETIGSLNFFASETHVFDDETRELGGLFASRMATGCANTFLYEERARLVDQLTEALESRNIISAAKGILMEREGCTDDEAFNLLKSASQNANVKLRTIAQGIVEQHNASFKR